jgi:hypothetical protein
VLQSDTQRLETRGRESPSLHGVCLGYVDMPCMVYRHIPKICHEETARGSRQPTNPSADIPKDTAPRSVISRVEDSMCTTSIRDLRLRLCLGYVIAAEHL